MNYKEQFVCLFVSCYPTRPGYRKETNAPSGIFWGDEKSKNRGAYFKIKTS